tara:strand:+ start:3477 stop:3920 length:444 start_codon:yes stop_codon:yes gene_type:complete
MSKISNKNSNNTKNNTKGVNICNTNNGIYSTTSSDVITSTYTGSNNISITSGRTSYTSYTSGDINISTTNSYNIGGIDVKFDRNLTFEEVQLIVGIDINGTKYYHSMIKNGITLYGDLKEKIEPIIKVLERKEKLGSILKNKEDEKC